MLDSESKEFQKDEVEQQKKQSSSMERNNVPMIRHTRQIAEEIGANSVLVYVDLIKSRMNLKTLLQKSHCI